jgi:hypothetical protein
MDREQPLQITLTLMRPFRWEQLLQTFLLQFSQVPLWFEQAVDRQISHLMLWAAQNVELQMWQTARCSRHAGSRQILQ